jgi:hypothetical protein
VNNHVDVDGILSIYTLVASGFALAHRQVILQAAEMGDFWGWGEPAAQRLFQGLTYLMEENRSPRETYHEAFRRIPGLIEGSDEESSHIEDSLAPLRRQVELVELGRISRVLRTDRLAQYIVPLDSAGDDERSAYVPGFNEAISSRASLWPQARARWDAQRVCIVSFERKTGWFHDVCCPGYLWADTENKWLVPGLSYGEGMGSYEIRNDLLIAAMKNLQQRETSPGWWGLGGTGLPFADHLQELFPVIARFLASEGRPAASQLSPDQVAVEFHKVFC